MHKKNFNFAWGDITKSVLPQGKDLIHYRDALQHLSLEQVHMALKNFKSADPKYLMVTSYPAGTNENINTGEYFDINLMREPFFLWPEYIFSENILPRHVKHYFVYTQEMIRA